MTETNFFCSDFSLASGESLPGTASRDQIWLMLEYNGPWESKAYEGSQLPEAVKARISVWLETQPNARVLLIRQPPTDDLAALAALSEHWTPNVDASYSFFVAHACETEPALYSFQMNQYEDLLSLDLPALLEGEESFAPFRIHEPLFLVCTNGRRDRCCARNGIPVYRAMSENARKLGLGRLVWQVSHVGGHRLSANVIHFPEGIYYGRVDPGEAPQLMAAVRQGEMYVDKARGRVCYDRPAQAAEIFLRRETGVRQLAAYTLVNAVEVKPGEWAARFMEGRQGPVHHVRVGIDANTPPVFQSCGSLEAKSVPRYYRIVHESAEGGSS